MSKCKIILGKDKLGRVVKRDLDSVNSMTNNNMLIIGSSGTGKTTSIFLPNICQKGQNIVISDPKGSLLAQYGDYLKSIYDIRILNLKDFSKSMHYNPLVYCENERDIIMLANIMCETNINGSTRHGNDDFWINSARSLLSSIMAYVCKTQSYANINDVLYILSKETNSYNESYKTTSLLDSLLSFNEENASRYNNNFISYSYNGYRSATGNTRDSILTSLHEILSNWVVGEVRECIRYDELKLWELFEAKYTEDKNIALFIIQDDVDVTKNMFATIIYSQLFKLGCNYADKNGGSLDTPVRFFLDDFATAGRVANLPHLISNIRSRNISVSLALQNESQLFSIYGEDAKTIIGNCNYYIYMGSTDINCRKEVSTRFNIPLFKLANFDKRKCLIDEGFGYHELYKFYDKKLINNAFEARKQKLDEMIKNNNDFTNIVSDDIENKQIYKNLSFFNGRYTLPQKINEYQLQEFDKQELLKIEAKNHLEKTKFNENLNIIDNSAEILLKEIDSEMDFLFENIENKMTSEFDEIWDDSITIYKRQDVFDSKAEELFYKKLIDYFKDNENIIIETHVRLSELFLDIDLSKTGKKKFRLNNMHCDYLILNKITRYPYMAIELDGPDHDKYEQRKLDLFKNLVFSNNNIILYRVNVINSHELSEDLCEYLDLINNNEFTQDTISNYYLNKNITLNP